MFGRRYVQALEQELARLRAELAELKQQNWALVRSLAGTAGLSLPEVPAPAPPMTSPPRPLLRRRSWQQWARWLERQASRPPETAQ